MDPVRHKHWQLLSCFSLEQELYLPVPFRMKSCYTAKTWKVLGGLIRKSNVEEHNSCRTKWSFYSAKQDLIRTGVYSFVFKDVLRWGHVKLLQVGTLLLSRKLYRLWCSEYFWVLFQYQLGRVFSIYSCIVCCVMMGFGLLCEELERGTDPIGNSFSSKRTL